jgi:hypothetical protein
MSLRKVPVDLEPFDEVDLKRRVTVWTLLTETTKAKTMIRRLQRDRTLFAPETHAIRRLLQRDPRVIGTAELVLDEISRKGSVLDKTLYYHVWSSWHRAFIDVTEAEVFSGEHAANQFRNEAGNAAVMTTDKALVAILNFVHMWCDEVHHDGYCNFLQAMRSNTMTVAPLQSDLNASGSALFSFPSLMPADAPSSPLSRPTPGDSPRLILSVSEQDEVHSRCATPQQAPLRRGLRVMWMPGCEDFSPKTVGPMRTPPRATRSGSLNSPGKLDPSKLDTDAQLQMWSPQKGSKPADDEDVDDDLEEFTQSSRRSIFEDSSFTSDLEGSKSHRSSPWIMGSSFGHNSTNANPANSSQLGFPSVPLGLGRSPSGTAEFTHNSTHVTNLDAPLAMTRQLSANNTLPLLARRRIRRDSSASSRGSSVRRGSDSQKRDMYTLPSPGSMRGRTDSQNRSCTTTTSSTDAN